MTFDLRDTPLRRCVSQCLEAKGVTMKIRIHAFAKCGASVLHKNERVSCGKTPAQHGVEFSRGCSESHPFVLTMVKG